LDAMDDRDFVMSKLFGTLRSHDDRSPVENSGMAA